MPEPVPAAAPTHSHACDGLPVGPPQPLQKSISRRATRRQWFVVLAIFGAALLWYGSGIAHPDAIVFDEVHYVGVARHYENGTFINPEWGERGLPYNFEHPPLAKYAIWMSMKALGDQPIGWRAPSAVLGAAGLAGLYLLGRRLFDHEVAGVAAAAALLLDPMYDLHARMAMLEVYPTAFAVWAFALALGPTPQRRASPILFGMAVASKYNALFILPVFVLVLWLTTGQRVAWRRAVSTLGLGVGVPLLVLVATYIPFLVLWGQVDGVVGAFVKLALTQVALFAWDFAANSTHTYSSGPLLWILLVRPVWYYVDRLGATEQYIYSLGNPMTWWPAAGAVIILLIALPTRFLRDHGRLLVSSRFWTHAAHLEVSWTQAARFALVMLMPLMAWLPYLVIQRITFIYYMTFIVPFLALVAAGLALWLWRQGHYGRLILTGWTSLAVVVFILYLPLVRAWALPPEWVNGILGLLPWMRR
jgi:dolichyl-phosphate-mannose-protein mannosyltransferase